MNNIFLEDINPDNSDIFATNSQCCDVPFNQYRDDLENLDCNYLKLLNCNIRSFHNNGDIFVSMLEDLPKLPEFIVVT